ncbi:restriction endonuclease [Catenovulum sediminis]|uniref:Restriction endonuclease n=1 Tax=Catenovulum sediminis TaxID=1740262 RepID=A0ABV1RFG2_9ALTE
MKNWQSYEEVSVFLLNELKQELGLSFVESKQKIKGNVTTWEVDGKGTRNKDETIIVIECRRYEKSKQSQEKLAAFAYRIKDVSASGGILVSPLGFQSGAKKIAAAENIIEIKLNSDSTIKDYDLQIFDKLFIGLGLDFKVKSDMSLEAELFRKCLRCNHRFNVRQNEKVCFKCAI